jgi:hypothetical protein
MEHPPPTHLSPRRAQLRATATPWHYTAQGRRASVPHNSGAVANETLRQNAECEMRNGMPPLPLDPIRNSRVSYS